MIPLIVTLPLLFSFILIIFTFFEKYKRYLKTTFLIGLLSAWPIFILNISNLPVGTVVGGWKRISGVEIELNSLNYYLILVELIVFSLVGVYSLFYFDSDKRRDSSFSSKMVFPLILLLYSGILGCFLTRDLFNFFVYF